MNKEKNLYNIDIDLGEILEETSNVDDYFYIQDLKQRKLYLNTDIDQFAVAGVVRHILQINREDKELPVEQRAPIILYVASNGGEANSGFELIDVIAASKTPVYTVNLGYQFSMGFLIGLAGHKRFAMKNAKFLMHDGSNFVYNSGTKAQDQMEFYRRAEERIRQYVIEHSRLTEEEYDNKLRVEWYLFADEAKEKGFVDAIIGVDCDIDEII